jgi:dTDP-glucose 4,6-dehydratase
MGFIGSNLVRELISQNYKVLNIDIVTTSSTEETLKDLKNNLLYSFARVDIRNYEDLKNIIEEFSPDKIFHLAAESHVDNSIDTPKIFFDTNIMGTFNLIDISKNYWIRKNKFKNFRLIHISTDEVYGDLGNSESPFNEETRYSPSSPYAASKASSDHLVRAWHRTYGLPSIVTNCSNNYGPYQFPEKLIPHMILNAVQGKFLPVYGDGSQIRDWLNVSDHVKALMQVMQRGKIGKTYNIGGLNEKKNIDVVRMICKFLEKLAPNKPKGVNSYYDLISFVKDRPGHDIRYAVDTTKITEELGWKSAETFETGLYKTVKWYLDNSTWWEKILSKSYKFERVGLGE